MPDILSDNGHSCLPLDSLNVLSLPALRARPALPVRSKIFLTSTDDHDPIDCLDRGEHVANSRIEFVAACLCWGGHDTLCGFQISLRERTAAKEKGRSAVRGIEEPDRTASLAVTQDKVCSGAVPPGGGCSEHQTIDSLPQPSATIDPTGDHLVGTPPGHRIQSPWSGR